MITPIRLLEPPILALPDADVSVWRVDDTYVLRIGPADEIGADCIEIPAHLLTAVWTTLKAAYEGGV